MEGNWTPVLHDSSNSNSEGQTYLNQTGRYLRVGSFVFIIGALQVNSLGSLANGDTARIGGLPFPVASPAGGIVATKVNYAHMSPIGTMVARATQGASYLSLAVHGSSGGTIGVSIADLGPGCNIEFMGIYLAA